MKSATASAAPGESQTNQNAADDDAVDDGAGLSGASGFAAALARELGEDGESGDADKGDKSGKGGESKPLPESLEAIAERLGIKASDLYNVKVPASGGREAMTLGQLKDRYATWDALESDRLAFSEERVKGESELTRARQEFQELLSIIPRDKLLNPEVMQRVAARVTERNKQLDAQVLTVVPEWKNPEVQTAERKAITELLAGYGVTDAEVKGIRHPGLVKFLRDAMRREQQVRKALESVRKVTKKPAQGQPAARGAPRQEQSQQNRNPMKPTTARERFSAQLHNER